VSTQTTFEDRLLDRLLLVVATNPGPREPGAPRPRRRRLPVATAGFASAGVVAALAVVIAGGTQAAYAIVSHPDGRVTVRLASLSDAAGLQAALRHRGIPAVVDYSATCRPVPYPPAPSVAHPNGGRPGHQVKQRSGARLQRARGRHAGVRIEVSKATHGTRGVIFTIDPSSIPAGQKLYITTYSSQMNALSVRIGSKATTPACPPTTP
jgi:hypothetical protein